MRSGNRERGPGEQEIGHERQGRRSEARDRGTRTGSGTAMKAHDGKRRQFIKGGVTAFTVRLCRTGVPLATSRSRQGVPSRNLVVLYLSGGNDALSMSSPTAIRTTTSVARRIAVPAGNGAADRDGRSGRRLRPAPAPDRSQADVRRRPPGDRPAHRLPELQPFALSPASTSGPRPIPATRRAPAGWAATSTAAATASIRWSPGTPCARRHAR